MVTFPHGGYSNIFRDLVGGGNNSPHAPLKAEIRDWGQVTEDWINSQTTDFAEFNPPFDLTPNMTLGGLNTSANRTFNASDTGTKPTHGVSVEINADTVHLDGERMFGGIGYFAQVRLDGGTGLQNSFASAILGYAVQNMNGDGDAIGVHGRARKTSIAGNIGDAAGVLGDAYQFSALAGGVMGLEGRIYNNVAGRLAADGYNGGAWETPMHLWSDSTGSPAHAGMLIGGAGKNAGKFSYWNGIVFTQESVAHNGAGAGILGTTAINFGNFSSSFHPEMTIKLGYADGLDSWHLYRGNSGIHVATNLFNVTQPNATGAAGLRLQSEGSFNAYIDLKNGNDFKGHFFWDNSSDDVFAGSSHNGDYVLRRSNAEKLRMNTAGVSVTGVIQVSGTQVVGAQQPAIADADSGDAGLIVDINNILAALRSHGLIAT